MYHLPIMTHTSALHYYARDFNADSNDNDYIKVRKENRGRSAYARKDEKYYSHNSIIHIGGASNIDVT